MTGSENEPRRKGLLEELGEILDKAHLRVDFDAMRDIMRPCTDCGTDSEPRTLVEITMPSGRKRDRPFCLRCAGLAK